MDSSKIIKRNEILEKHNRLQDEYNNLCNTDNLMTYKEFQKLEDKKQSILLEIDRCKALEKSFDDESTKANANNFSLQMLTTKEVLELLHCSEPTLKNWVNIGMLKPIKTGKSFLFVQEDIYNFQKKYMGYDISNYEKSLLVYNEVNS